MHRSRRASGALQLEACAARRRRCKGHDGAHLQGRRLRALSFRALSPGCVAYAALARGLQRATRIPHECCSGREPASEAARPVAGSPQHARRTNGHASLAAADRRQRWRPREGGSEAGNPGRESLSRSTPAVFSQRAASTAATSSIPRRRSSDCRKSSILGSVTLPGASSVKPPSTRLKSGGQLGRASTLELDGHCRLSRKPALTTRGRLSAGFSSRVSASGGSGETFGSTAEATGLSVDSGNAVVCSLLRRWV